MKKTITESGGLYWVQHSPPRALIRTAIGAHRSVREYVSDLVGVARSAFRRMHSFAGDQPSRLLVGSFGTRLVSPCLQRLPRRSRRLVLLAR